MYVKVRVTPSGKREIVTKVDDTTYEMVVKEKAQGNAANKRVQSILSSLYNVKIGDVRIVTGHRSGSKIYTITLET